MISIFPNNQKNMYCHNGKDIKISLDLRKGIVNAHKGVYQSVDQIYQIHVYQSV